jgi:hypothetical protein
MTIDNFFIIEIKVDGMSIFGSEKLFSFSLKESIYKIYTSGMLSIKDLTALIQESFLLVEGSIIEVEYGLVNKVTNKCKYVVTKELLDKVTHIGNLVGELELELEHEWLVKQTIRSAAYRNRIDLIVQSLVSQYAFANNDIDINSTGNEDTHYQPLLNDADFISKKLVPIAFSNNSENTPFYAFTTSDNVFHFRNAQSMMNNNPVAEYTYKKESFENTQSIDIEKMVLTLKRWKEGIGYYLKDSYYTVYKQSRKTGELIEEQRSIFSAGTNNENEGVPLVFGGTTKQAYLDQNYEQVVNDVPLVGLQETQKGHNNFLRRGSAFVDRFMCIVPFNPKLHAGSTIKLNIYVRKPNGESLSVAYSGKYLIEELEQVWNGDERKGYSIMKIGRKYTTIDKNLSTKSASFISKPSV